MASTFSIHVGLTALLLLSVAIAQSSDESLRQTSTGVVRGFKRTALGKNVDIFLGIPFAEPPTGERRFRRPEKIKSWTGVRDVSKYSPACYQDVDDSFDKFEGVDMWNPNTGISEDCLYLNIWQPRGGTSKKAVLIWIYGGSYSTGSSTLSVYDAIYLAAKGDVVVVSMQYRIGPFGFLHLNGATDRDAGQGNMGLLDQSMAIQWFSENAEIFGGDKSRITLFGESAGAASVNYQMISALTSKLFKSAIMQSASALSPWAYDPPEWAQTKALALAKLVSCNTESANRTLTGTERAAIIECLQKVPAATLSEKQFSVNDEESLIASAFAPTLDNYFIKEPPSEAIKKQSQGIKPILAGVNKNEGVYFLAYTQQSRFPVQEKVIPLTETDFEAGVNDIFKVDKKFVVDTVIFEYGSSSKSNGGTLEYRDILDDVLGDASFKCAVVGLAHIQSAAGGNVYLYEFNHRTSANKWPLWMGVMHGYEIDHVFGLPFNDSLRYTAEERTLSEAMVTYWTNFAKSGNPNQGDNQISNVKVTWPAYKLTDRMVMALNTSSVYAKSGIRERPCEFWRKIVPELRQAATGVIECKAGLSSVRITISSLLLSFTLFYLLAYV